MSVVDDVVRVMMLFAHAMVANATPLIARRFIFKNVKPLDFGKTFIDGKRVLGDNKSVEGFLSGVLAGFFTGIAYALYFSNISWIYYGLISGLGAMLGDVFNSFFKRRLSLKPGEPFIPLDQTSFLLLAYVLIRISSADSMVGYSLTTHDLLIGVLIALVLHPLTNYVAFLLKIKKTPL